MIFYCRNQHMYFRNAPKRTHCCVSMTTVNLVILLAATHCCISIATATVSYCLLLRTQTRVFLVCDGYFEVVLEKLWKVGADQNRVQRFDTAINL